MGIDLKAEFRRCVDEGFVVEQLLGNTYGGRKTLIGGYLERCKRKTRCALCEKFMSKGDRRMTLITARVNAAKTKSGGSWRNEKHFLHPACYRKAVKGNGPSRPEVVHCEICGVKTVGRIAVARKPLGDVLWACRGCAESVPKCDSCGLRSLPGNLHRLAHGAQPRWFIDDEDDSRGGLFRICGQCELNSDAFTERRVADLNRRVDAAERDLAQWLGD